MERGPRARHALDGHLAAHELHQAFANSQAETGAAIFARGGSLHLTKRLKELVQLLRANPDARVADGESYVEPAIFAPLVWSPGFSRSTGAGQRLRSDAQFHLTLRRKFDRIRDEIYQNL